MNLMIGILSFLAFVSCILITTLIIWKLKDRLIAKYILFGACIYLMLRVLLYPIIFSLFSIQVIWVKLLFDVLYLLICFIYVKKRIIQKIVKQGIQSNILISFGFGEGLAEVIFLIFPSLLNYFLFFCIGFSNSLNNFFGSVYSEEEISSFLSIFNELPATYFIYMSIAIFSLMIFQIIGTIMLFKDYKISIIMGLVFYSIYIILSFMNYGFALLAFIVFDFLIIKIIKRGLV